MAKTLDDYAKLTKRLSLTLVTAYGISLIFFFGYSLFTFPEKHFLIPFRLSWTLLQTVAYFIETLIPVHCSAVIVVCSLFAPPLPALKSGLQEAFKRLVFSTVAIFILIGIIYIVFSEGFLPAVYGKLHDLENRTSIARNYLKLAEDAKIRGDSRLRRAYLEYYLSIDPNNETIVESLAELTLHSTDGAKEPSQPESPKRARLMDLNTEELFQRAQRSREQEDYYTAYYFADLARALSPPGSEDARRAGQLAKEIQTRLSSYTADIEELKRKAVFEIKTQAHSDLLSDEVHLVTRAYFTFLHLTERYPDDPEAEKYLKEATEKLETMAFFRDDVERFASMPGINQLFFVDGLRVVAIGGIIRTEHGNYAREIETVDYSETGGVISHIKASSGKILTGAEDGIDIFLVGIDRNDSSNTLVPEYYAGEGRNSIHLSPSLEELELLGSEGRNIDSHHLNKLWGMWDTVAPYGYPAEPIEAGTLARINSAFSFIILSLIALILGWKLRPAGAFPAVAGIIIVPVLPIVAFFFVQSYDYVLMLLTGSALLAWGFIPSLIVLIALNFALIICSIALLAAQSLKPSEPQPN